MGYLWIDFPLVCLGVSDLAVEGLVVAVDGGGVLWGHQICWWCVLGLHLFLMVEGWYGQVGHAHHGEKSWCHGSALLQPTMVLYGLVRINVSYQVYLTTLVSQCSSTDGVDPLIQKWKRCRFSKDSKVFGFYLSHRTTALLRGVSQWIYGGTHLPLHHLVLRHIFSKES